MFRSSNYILYSYILLQLYSPSATPLHQLGIFPTHFIRSLLQNILDIIAIPCHLDCIWMVSCTTSMPFDVSCSKLQRTPRRWINRYWQPLTKFDRVYTRNQNKYISEYAIHARLFQQSTLLRVLSTDNNRYLLPWCWVYFCITCNQKLKREYVILTSVQFMVL